MRTEHRAGQGCESNEHDLHRRLADLESHIRNLQDAVTSHERIGIATGLLAHRLDCSAGRAWELLVWISQTTNVKVRDVARVLVDVQAHQLSDADRGFVDAIDRLLSHRERFPQPRPACPDATAKTHAGGRQYAPMT